MKFLESFIEKNRHLFESGGKYNKFYALFEAIDTFLLTPATVTTGRTHIRDSLDLKRTMITVVAALLPCVFFGMYNVGYQAHTALALNAAGSTSYNINTWQLSILNMLGLSLGSANSSHVDFIIYGALCFLPIWLVTNIVGGFWEGLFCIVRKHEINEGFLVTGWLFPLTLPPTIPLWQVAMGISFGVVFGKEVFGGTGKNIFNPALMARAFLFFAFPAQISGDAVWTAIDGFTGATPLGQAASGGLDALTFTWTQAFWGFVPGSFGETSFVACLLGALLLVITGIGSWRIMLSALLGLITMSLTLNFFGTGNQPMTAIPFYWHMVLGSFAFAVVFMATDPVSAAMTNTGRYIYGFLIGSLGTLIRVGNPAYPEGWMLSILFMNAFAPTIDYLVVRSNIKRRAARNG